MKTRATQSRSFGTPCGTSAPLPGYNSHSMIRWTATHRRSSAPGSSRRPPKTVATCRKSLPSTTTASPIERTSSITSESSHAKSATRARLTLDTERKVAVKQPAANVVDDGTQPPIVNALTVCAADRVVRMTHDCPRAQVVAVLVANRLERMPQSIEAAVRFVDFRPNAQLAEFSRQRARLGIGEPALPAFGSEHQGICVRLAGIQGRLQGCYGFRPQRTSSPDPRLRTRVVEPATR